MMNLFKDLTVNDNAKMAQLQTVCYLEDRGYVCKIEQHVRDRYDGRPGRIDILANNKYHTIAIEVDHHNPRMKSIFKLNNYKADYKYILLRGLSGCNHIFSNNIFVVGIKIK